VQASITSHIAEFYTVESMCSTNHIELSQMFRYLLDQNMRNIYQILNCIERRLEIVHPNWVTFISPSLLLHGNLALRVCFTFSAVAKATGMILDSPIQSNDVKVNANTRSDLFRLLSLSIFNPVTFIPFGGGDDMLAVPTVQENLSAFSSKWRNVSELMHCVACQVNEHCE